MPEHFYETIPGMKKEVWEVFYNTVKSLYPQYVDILDDFSNGSLMNCCNMFIMKKDLFFEYNDFCFNILKEVDRQIDSSKFDKQEQRFLGYLGEYVLSIFVRILQKRNSKVKYLDAIMFMNIQNICTINLKPIQKLFCITNSGNKKLISIFGKRFYLNRWDNKKEFAKLTIAVHEQSKTIEKLNKKIEKLQRELETINRG
jgi:hypothetical protein